MSSEGAITYVTADTEGETARQAMRAFVSEVLEAEPVVIDAELHDRQVAWTLDLPRAAARATGARALHGWVSAVPPSTGRCATSRRPRGRRMGTGRRGRSRIPTPPSPRSEGSSRNSRDSGTRSSAAMPRRCANMGTAAESLSRALAR